MILDGGACDVGIESTIVAFVHGGPLLLRPGGIDIDALTRVLRVRPPHAPMRTRRARPERSPRTTRRARRRFWCRRTACGPRSRNARTVTSASPCLQGRSDAPPAFDGSWMRAPANAVSYAHDLYANLRKLDAAGTDAILIEAVPDTPEWLAVSDRLTRATHAEAQDDRD